MRKYYVARTCHEIDKIETVDLMWNMYGVSLFSIEEKWVRDLYRLTGSCEEVSETVGRWGSKHFGEIRLQVKVTDEDPLSVDDEYALSQQGAKIKIKLPQERIDAAITFMKLTAKLVIEDQYDRKFLSLKAEESKLEQYLWGSQVREANNLEGSTPVLNTIANAKGITTAEVAKGVLAGHDKFNQKVVALYKEMLELKHKFKTAATIKELNTLWETYMGIPVPLAQAAEEGHVEADGYTPFDVKPGLQF